MYYIRLILEIFYIIGVFVENEYLLFKKILFIYVLNNYVF